MGIVAAALQMVANLAFVGAAGCDRARSVRNPGKPHTPDTPQCLILRLLRSRSQPACLVSDYRRLVVIPALVVAAEGCDRTRSVRKPGNLIRLTHRSAISCVSCRAYRAFRRLFRVRR